MWHIPNWMVLTTATAGKIRLPGVFDWAGLQARLAKLLRGTRSAERDPRIRLLRTERLEDRQMLSLSPTAPTLTGFNNISPAPLTVIVAPQGANSGSVDVQANGIAFGSAPPINDAATASAPESTKYVQTIAALPLGGANFTTSATTPLYNASTGNPLTPQYSGPTLADKLDVAQLYTQNGDTSQASPFTISPSSFIPSTANYGWVSGLRQILISTSYDGIVENLTIEVHGANHWNYAPTRSALNAGDRTTIFQLNQPINGPEKILITAYLASNPSDKAYFRLDNLPGDIYQLGTVDQSDVDIEEYYVQNPPTDPSTIAYLDMNGDGVIDQSDADFIQNQINAGKTTLPDQVVISDNVNYGNFGSVVAGSTHHIVPTIVNDGTTPVTNLGSGASFSSPAFSFAGGTFPGAGGSATSTLPAWQSAFINVLFHPTTTGPFSGTLQIPYFDGTSTETASFDLSGTALAPALLSITNLSTLYFENNGGSPADTTFTLTNNGQWPATNIASATANLVYPGAFGTATTTLAAGASVTMAARFYDGSGPATLSPTLSLSYFDGAQTTSVTVPTTGLNIVVTGGVLNAGSISGVQNVTLTGGSVLNAVSIFSDTLTMGAGTRLTIAPIAGGLQAANSTLTPLATLALQPISRKSVTQPTAAVAITPSSSTDITTVASDPIGANTVIATLAPVSCEAASALASSDSSLSDSNALTPGPSPKGRGEVLLESLNTILDAIAAPAEILADIAPPVRLVESTAARLIDTATKYVPPKAVIYSRIDSTALHQIIESGLEQPLATNNGNITSTPILGSLRDELPSRVEKIEKHRIIPAINGPQAHFAALETIMQNPLWNDVDAEADFDIVQHVHAGKHSKQLEKAVDEVLAEEEDAIPVEL